MALLAFELNFLAGGLEARTARLSIVRKGTSAGDDGLSAESYSVRFSFSVSDAFKVRITDNPP